MSLNSNEAPELVPLIGCALYCGLERFQEWGVALVIEV